MRAVEEALVSVADVAERVPTDADDALRLVVVALVAMRLVVDADVAERTLTDADDASRDEMVVVARVVLPDTTAVLVVRLVAVVVPSTV